MTTTGTYPPQTFTTPNVVGLIVHGRYDEAVAAGTIPVGSLVMLAAGQVQVHNVAGGRAERAFARERQLIGLSYPSPIGVWDSYVANDLVGYYLDVPGDEILALLSNGQNLAADTMLMSAGDGTLTAWVPGPGLVLTESVADSTTITNTTTETTFSTGSYVIPANYLQAGDVIHVRAQGKVPGVNSTDTQLVKLKIGSTVIASVPATNYTANDEFIIDAYIVVRTNGASGTFIANGTYEGGTPGTATVKTFLLASTAIDTTVDETLAVTATASVANAGDQIVLNQFLAEIERGGGFAAVALLLDATNNSGGTSGQPYSPAAQARVRVM